MAPCPGNVDNELPYAVKHAGAAEQRRELQRDVAEKMRYGMDVEERDEPPPASGRNRA